MPPGTGQERTLRICWPVRQLRAQPAQLAQREMDEAQARIDRRNQVDQRNQLDQGRHHAEPEQRRAVAAEDFLVFLARGVADRRGQRAAAGRGEGLKRFRGQGLLQFDLWSVAPLEDAGLDWTALKERVQTVGLRNSLLIAPMPTASTSQILGFNECFEPFTTNIYSRRTLAGEFTIVNKYLMTELREAGLWTDFLKQEIVARNGSVQGIAAIPAEMQARYKTTWEIKQRTLIDMAAARGAFIDQSQSLNLFVADPTYSKLTSMHFYAWKAGLKTGCYYLRSKAPVVAQQFTVDPRLLTAISSGGKVAEIVSDSEDDDDDDSDEEKEKAPALTTADARKLLLERLAAEADAEGCLSCGS